MVTITIKENSKNEKIPNAKTIKAMKDAEKGIVFVAKNKDDLIKKLNS